MSGSWIIDRMPLARVLHKAPESLHYSSATVQDILLMGSLKHSFFDRQAPVDPDSSLILGVVSIESQLRVTSHGRGVQLGG